MTEPPSVDARRVLAFRLAGQRLGAPAADVHEVLSSWTLQDSPSGAAAAAVLARVEAPEPGWLEPALFERRTAVALYNPRTATAILPAEQAAAFGTALIPDDDPGLQAIVGPALPECREGFGEAVALAVAAVGDALDGAVLSRDDLHEALRGRLPGDLLPWCEGCQSHHARRGLLVMAALHGRLCLAGRVGRQPAFARTDQWTGWEAPGGAEAGADLVRRYLTAYGPSTPAHLAQWAGLGAAHARALWRLVEPELAEVRVDGGVRAFVLADRLSLLDSPPAAAGVRLLGAGDPLLLGRDRELLVPDPAVRRRLWPAINAPGLILADGAPAALWRARKQGRRLALAVEAFAPLPLAAVQAEAERLAPHRGCGIVEIDWR